MKETSFSRRVELYSPETEVELILLQSVLTAAGIDYFVKNKTFGALTPGPQIALCNRRTFLVPEDQLAEARELVREFLHRTGAPEPRRYPLREKIRMVVEFLFFGWFLPGRRHRPPQLRLIHTAPPGDDQPPRRTPDERSPVPRRGPPRLRLVHPRRPERRHPEPHDPERSDPATTSGARDRTPER